MSKPKKLREVYLSMDGTFPLDSSRPHKAVDSVLSVLQRWYEAHRYGQAVIVISPKLHENIRWMIEHYFKQTNPVVHIKYDEALDKTVARIETYKAEYLV